MPNFICTQHKQRVVIVTLLYSKASLLQGLPHDCAHQQPITTRCSKLRFRLLYDQLGMRCSRDQHHCHVTELDQSD